MSMAVTTPSQPLQIPTATNHQQIVAQPQVTSMAVTTPSQLDIFQSSQIFPQSSSPLLLPPSLFSTSLNVSPLYSVSRWLHYFQLAAQLNYAARKV